MAVPESGTRVRHKLFEMNDKVQQKMVYSLNGTLFSDFAQCAQSLTGNALVEYETSSVLSAIYKAEFLGSSLESACYVLNKGCYDKRRVVTLTLKT